MSKIYLDILDRNRKQVFASLSRIPHKGYLGGGTALALQIHHRLSYDFDIFVPYEISPMLRKSIKDTFPDYKIIYDASDQVTFQTHDVSVTFLWYYFKHVQPLITTEYLPLASLIDIAADKAHTLGRRVVWRDYVDMYFILQHASLDAVIASAKKKFQGEFNESLFLEQLVYFKNLEIVPISFIEEKPTDDMIKTTLQEKVSSYMKSIIR